MTLFVGLKSDKYLVPGGTRFGHCSIDGRLWVTIPEENRPQITRIAPAGCAYTQVMLVTAAQDLRLYVEDHSGALFVRCHRQHLCRGVSLLQATTKEPRSLDGYELFVVEGIFVFTQLPAHMRPEELHLSLEGRRRKRPVASWDGCGFAA